MVPICNNNSDVNNTVNNNNNNNVSNNNNNELHSIFTAPGVVQSAIVFARG